MRFSEVFTVLSLTVAAIAMPNAIPNSPSNEQGFKCDANVGGQLACCATTQQVNKHQPDVLPKLFSALNSPGGFLNGLLQTLYLLLQVPVEVSAGVDCVLLQFTSKVNRHANLTMQRFRYSRHS